MNTKTQESLEMAIEALIQAHKQLGKYWDADIKRGYDIEEMNDSPMLSCRDAIRACKEALATNEESLLVQPNALKMAIEAFDSCDSAEGMSGPYQFYDAKLIDKAIQACKEALAQPQPKLFLDLSNSNGNHPVQQDPVAVVETIGGHPDESVHTVKWLVKYKDLKDGDKLYTHPAPAREQEPDAWDDKQDEWSDEIAQSHPLKTKRNIEYDIARKMVSNRHSKGALVDLVCWLLQKAHPAPSWQGLSNDEIGRLAVFDGLHHVEIPLLAKFILAIEQALKEKNT
jgi:hypothetical protein